MDHGGVGVNSISVTNPLQTAGLVGARQRREIDDLYGVAGRARGIVGGPDQET